MRSSSKAMQDALWLVVLADEVLLSIDAGQDVDIPILTESGIAKIVRYDMSESIAITAQIDPIAEVLEGYESIKPFVLSKLMVPATSAEGETLLPHPADAKVARSLGLSRRKFYDYLIQYAYDYYRGGDTASSPLAALVPSTDRREVIDTKLKRRTLDNRVMGIIIDALFATAQFTNFVDLSVKLNATLAGGEYTSSIDQRSFRSTPYSRAEDDLAAVSIVRAAIAEADGEAFRIQGIRHAMQLRTDPALKSLRHRIKELREALLKGDAVLVGEAGKDVAQARRALRRAHAWGRSINWVTYLALPTALVEPLLLGSPGVLGIILALYAVAGTSAQQWLEKRHGWVLFGRS